MSEIAPVAQINEVDGQSDRTYTLDELVGPVSVEAPADVDSQPQLGERLQVDEIINTDQKLRALQALATRIAEARQQNDSPESETKYLRQLEDLETGVTEWAARNSVDGHIADEVHERIMDIAGNYPSVDESSRGAEPASPESDSLPQLSERAQKHLRALEAKAVQIAEARFRNSLPDSDAAYWRDVARLRLSVDQWVTMHSIDGGNAVEAHHRIMGLATDGPAPDVVRDEPTGEAISDEAVDSSTHEARQQMYEELWGLPAESDDRAAYENHAVNTDEAAYNAAMARRSAAEASGRQNGLNAELEESIMADVSMRRMYLLAQTIAAERAKIGTDPDAQRIVNEREATLSLLMARYRAAHPGDPNVDRKLDFIMDATREDSHGLVLDADGSYVGPISHGTPVPPEAAPSGLPAWLRDPADDPDLVPAPAEADPVFTGYEDVVSPEILAAVGDRATIEELIAFREQYAAITAENRRRAFGRMAQMSIFRGAPGTGLIFKGIDWFNSRQNRKGNEAAEGYQNMLDEVMQRVREHNESQGFSGERLKAEMASAYIGEDFNLEDAIIADQHNTKVGAITEIWTSYGGFKGKLKKGLILTSLPGTAGLAAGVAGGLIAGASVVTGVGLGVAAGAVTGSYLLRKINRERLGVPEPGDNVSRAVRLADVAHAAKVDALLNAPDIEAQRRMAVEMTEEDTTQQMANNRRRVLGAVGLAAVIGGVMGGVGAEYIELRTVAGSSSGDTAGMAAGTSNEATPAPTSTPLGDGLNPENNLESGQTTLDQAGSSSNLDSGQETLAQGGNQPAPAEAAPSAPAASPTDNLESGQSTLAGAGDQNNLESGQQTLSQSGDQPAIPDAAPAPEAVNSPADNLESGQSTLGETGNQPAAEAATLTPEASPADNLTDGQQTLDQAGQAPTDQMQEAARTAAEQLQVPAYFDVSRAEGITQAVQQEADKLGVHFSIRELYDLYEELEKLGLEGIVDGAGHLYTMENGDFGFVQPEQGLKWTDEARQIIANAVTRR